MLDKEVVRTLGHILMIILDFCRKIKIIERKNELSFIIIIYYY